MKMQIKFEFGWKIINSAKMNNNNALSINFRLSLLASR